QSKGVPATMNYDLVAGGFSVSYGLHIVVVPLLISAVAVGFAYWWSRFSGRRSPGQSVAAVWLRVGVTAVGYAVALILLQLIFAARLDSSMGGFATVHIVLSAVTVRTFFVPLFAIGIGSAIGRAAGHPYGLAALGAGFLRRTIPAARAAGVHFAVSAGVLTLASLTGFLFQAGWRGADLFVSGIAGVYLPGVAHFGAISVSGSGELLHFSSSKS